MARIYVDYYWLDIIVLTPIMVVNGGFGCLKLVLYGIRELASATP